MNKKNYYEILGVSNDASLEDIKTIFINLLKFIILILIKMLMLTVRLLKLMKLMKFYQTLNLDKNMTYL